MNESNIAIKIVLSIVFILFTIGIYAYGNYKTKQRQEEKDKKWMLDPMNPSGKNFDEDLFLKVQAETNVQMQKEFGSF